MRIYIPRLGSLLTLQQDWTFTVHPERRNAAIFKLKKLNMKDYEGVWGRLEKTPTQCVPGYPNYHYYKCGYVTKPKPIQYSLPRGTVLKLERIYIRQGNTEFDSLTFSYEHEKKRVRFWVKLVDANGLRVTEEEACK